MKDNQGSNSDGLDEILWDAFVGLYGKQPSDNGLDFDFVPMEDSYGVLKADLKKQLTAYINEVVNEARQDELNRARDDNTARINFKYIVRRRAELTKAKKLIGEG